MAQDRDGAARHHGERLHVHGESVHLHPIDLIAGEGAAQRVDADVLRLDVAGLGQLSRRDCAQRRSLHTSAEAARGANEVASFPAEPADDIRPPSGYRKWFHVNTMIRLRSLARHAAPKQRKLGC
jgi:hypothetical protein